MPTTRIDSNRIRYTYPLLRKIPFYGEVAGGGANTVEVAIINFDDTNIQSYTFLNNYTEIPICVITAEDENVNVYITSLSTTAIQVTGSSDFTGKVHVHIYPRDEV